MSEDITPFNLEAFFINNERLSVLASQLNVFNPIKVMKMESMEIRHSAILAWLLDPRESHGLEDKFLKAFLMESLRGHQWPGSVSALDVSTTDLRDAIIRLEWKDIDIFISCGNCGKNKNETWTFIVENKFHSKQSHKQLEKYRKKIESIFGFKQQSQTVTETSVNVIKLNGIFLTLEDESPDEPSFSHIRYEDVVPVLEYTCRNHGKNLSKETAIFINHYISILKEATGMSETHDEMVRLARELYLDHKKVIDFVVEHGTTTEFAMASRLIFGDIPDEDKVVKLGDSSHFYTDMSDDHVGFTPKLWADTFDKHLSLDDEYLCPLVEGWQDYYPLTCWFKFSSDDHDDRKGSISLKAVIAPFRETADRQSLIDIITAGAEAKLKIKSGSKSSSKSGVHIFTENQRSVPDIYDPEDIKNAMIDLATDFKTEFKLVAKILSDFYADAKEANI